MQVGKDNFFNGLKNGVGRSVGSRLLTIQNVTTEDEGDYICEVVVHSGHSNRANYALKVFGMFYKKKLIYIILYYQYYCIFYIFFYVCSTWHNLFEFNSSRWYLWNNK